MGDALRGLKIYGAPELFIGQFQPSLTLSLSLSDSPKVSRFLLLLFFSSLLSLQPAGFVRVGLNILFACNRLLSARDLYFLCIIRGGLTVKWRVTSFRGKHEPFFSLSLYTLLLWDFKREVLTELPADYGSGKFMIASFL